MYNQNKTSVWTDQTMQRRMRGEGEGVTRMFVCSGGVSGLVADFDGFGYFEVCNIPTNSLNSNFE